MGWQVCGGTHLLGSNEPEALQHKEVTVRFPIAILQEYGVSGSGRKMDIIDRIKDAMGMAD